MKGRTWLTRIFVLVCLLLWPAFSNATEMSDTGNGDEKIELFALSELSESFEYTLRTVAFGAYQNAAKSSQNPHNDFYQIPRYLAEFEFRPDARINLNRLDLSVNPRVNLEWTAWEDGIRKGDTDWNDDWFVNEWLARIRITEDMFVSYGRENLQWGPSFLCSPSNPFFRDNGQSNPMREVPGMDFGRLVWLPGMSWTFSLIANPDEGRQEFLFFEFEKTYALKLDYAGQGGYASLILSHKEKDRNRLGVFGGWTASDALLLYGEGAIARGADALYPKTANNPFGATMEAVYDDDSSLKGTLLAGGSYTFEVGPTISVEYVYNGAGYSDDQADAYYRLRKKASEGLDAADSIRGLSLLTLSQTADTGLRLLRRNYVLLQYRHNAIRDVLDLTFRWTRNMDDGSGQFISIVEYFAGDHIKLFSVGTLNSGGGDTEFGTILDHQLMIGLEYTF